MRVAVKIIVELKRNRRFLKCRIVEKILSSDVLNLVTRYFFFSYLPMPMYFPFWITRLSKNFVTGWMREMIAKLKEINKNEKK